MYQSKSMIIAICKFLTVPHVHLPVKTILKAFDLSTLQVSYRTMDTNKRIIFS
jgi:hypothetical protein